MSNEVQAREIDNLSSALVVAGVRTIKKNPIKFSAYIVGVLICFFFNGYKCSPESLKKYEDIISNVDYSNVEIAKSKLHRYYDQYYHSKGWFFTCDKTCQINYKEYQVAQREFDMVRGIEEEKISKAKSHLGVFSEHGVAETRDLFWDRFSQGKQFASRQSKWDLLFISIRAIGRDESLVEYLLRLLLSVLFNLTIGVCSAVITFVFGYVVELHSLVAYG
jgi:hypothetical protein